MFKVLYPYEYVESVFDIDYQKLYQSGFRGLIFDIDNTLVHHGKDSTPEIDELFEYLHTIGFKTLLLSNNDTPRIERFIRNIDTLYIPDADKPDTAGFYKALQMLKLSKSQVVCIGDQVFTDVYGANRCKIPNILVKFIQPAGETKIGIRRNVEKIVLWFYKRRRSCLCRLGDIRKVRE